MSIADGYSIVYNGFVKTYPICLVGLEHKHAIVVGGGNVALRKVNDLLEADARVTVISPTLAPELRALAEARRITVIERPYRAGDLRNAFLVIAATNDPNVNQRVWQEAEQCGCLANAVDDPAHCHFITPAVIRRNHVVVTVSTGGRSPALARRLRERLETLIGAEYGELADLLAELRPEIQSRYEDEKERKQAAFRLVDSDLIDIIKEKGVEEAREYAWGLLNEDGK
ncbi:MAG: bifunctional precorrin-2 dehydrogenase/sirohydrochlorin ferrochelatase [Anaerolineae bacterium]